MTESNLQGKSVKQYTTHLDVGKDLSFGCNSTKKYTLHFQATGMMLEVVMLPGQYLNIKGITSDLVVDVEDAEPLLPGGGLQLVPPPV